MENQSATSISQAVTDVEDHVTNILKLTWTSINDAIQQEQHLTITGLSEEIAKKLSLGYNFVYAVAGQYVENNREIVCAKGKGMGIMLKSKYDAIQEKQAAAKEEKTFSKFTVTIREIGMTKEEFEKAKRDLHTESPTLASLKGWFAANGK